MTPLLVALIPVYNYGRKRSIATPLLFLGAGTVVLLLVLVAVGDMSWVLGLMDKDTSLSGRTEIWSLVWQKILAHPLLGYGYSAFLAWRRRGNKSGGNLGRAALASPPLTQWFF